MTREECVLRPGAEGPPLPCASGCAPGVLKNVGRTNAENTKSARRSESTANEYGSAAVRDGAFSRVTTARHRMRKVYPGCSEGSLRNRSSKASRSARVSHSARARHGTPVRELDLPVARSHVGTERLPRSTQRTRWPSPSPPTSPRRRRLPPGDASRPSAASPRAQARVSRCPSSTRRYVSRVCCAPEDRAC